MIGYTLIECSIVPIPANPDAYIASLSDWSPRVPWSVYIGVTIFGGLAGSWIGYCVAQIIRLAGN